MLAALNEIWTDLALNPQTLLLLGIGVGVFILVYGIAGATAGPAPEIRRMRPENLKAARGTDFDLIRGGDEVANAFLKAFVPSSKRERSKVALQMRQAGFHGRYAIWWYLLARVSLATAFGATRKAVP